MADKTDYEAKLQEISQLTADTEKNLTRSRQNWTAFLTTAARLYKYPYNEQLMIYAQRPEATACAEFNIWNQRMNRYVRRGSKGIALLNNDGDNPEIRYVFDVSDTGTRDNSRSVNQWILTDENEQAVMTALSGKYDVPENSGISVQLESIAAQLVDEFWNNHKRTIIGIVDDSFLEEYDEDNIGMAFRNAGVVSTTYTLLSRCGLDPDGYFEHEDFLSVFDFNTPGTVAVLGSAVSECAENVLRQIEVTIKTFEKERSKDYVRNHLQTERGLSHSEPQIEGQREETSRQIRQDEESVSKGTQPDTVESPHIVRETVRPPSRSGRIGNKPHGAASFTVDEAVRSNRGTESERPNEVGAVDEQHSSDSRGNSAERADIQLTFDSQQGEQLSLFASEAEQIRMIDETESILPSVFSFTNTLSQDVIDEALRLGSNDEESRIKICAHFMKGKPLEENAVFLAEHYKTNGAGFYVNDRKYAMWYSIGGIQIADGETANKPYATTVTWEQAAERIKELLDEGKYMPQWEIDRAENFEAKDVSDRLLYMTADISEEGKNLNLLPTVSAIRDLRKGYPEETQVLFEYLNNPQKLKKIVAEMELFLTAYKQNSDILRFRFYKPQELFNRLKDMQAEKLVFSADRSYEPEHKCFISQDEIDNILSYRNTLEYRLEVYSYFITHPDPEERMKFLRKSHGEYSGSHSGNDNLTYTSKGIKFTHGDIINPYAEVQLPWKKASKRIAELIKADRYLSVKDKENMPDYERHRLATSIHSFFFGVNENTPFPRTDDDISNYWDNVKTIQEQLTDPVRVREIYNDMMLPVWNETKPDDRYYEYRKKGFEDMTAYIEGRYSVFGKDAPLEPLPKIEENAPSKSSYFDEVADIIADNPDDVILFQVGDFFEMYGEDAEIAVEQLGLIATTRYIPEMGTVPMCGIPSHILEQNVEKLREHFNVIVSGITNGERNQYRLPSYDESVRAHTYETEEYDNFDDVDPAAIRENLVEHGIVNGEVVDPEAYDVVLQTIKTTEPKIPEETVVRENFHITDEHLGEGGAKAKFRMNMDAINLLKELEFEGRNATPEEQKVLSRYVGWGGLSEAFDETKENWADEYKELIVALSPEEYEAARGTVLNSHYTSPTVIKAMYDALANMGFTKGNILEPSMGIGNFFGMLPDEMKDSRLYGVELDSLTGRIAKQLYPKADITIGGFETTDRKDFYDVAIGNVPFGQYKVNDRAFNKLDFNIHNYFFAKALDQVRPGGVVAFITSRHTMDSKNQEVRKYLAQRADLLGAIRLPNNAFKANANTEVVSDIIFLQKRESPIAIEPDWVALGTNEQGYAVNRYFLDNPEMVMGRETERSTAHGMDYTVEPYEDLPLSTQLAYAVQNIGGTYTEAQITDLSDEAEVKVSKSIPADPDVKNYSFTVVDNEVYYRENSIMAVPDVNTTAKERIKGMVGLRNCVNELIELQMNERTTDYEIKEKQAELNYLYDTFSKKYGLINDRANRLAFESDSSYYLLCSLEVLDNNKKLKRKADMFTKRTIRQRNPVDRVDTASEALAVSIGEKACVDLGYMAQLMGGTEKIPQIVEDLKGVIFKDPVTGSFDYDQNGENWANGWQTADEYLSGNVRAKLRTAKRIAENSPEFQINVDALEKVQPKDLEASDIEVRIGTTWIDKSYFQQFMQETFETPYRLQDYVTVKYSPVTAEWKIEGKTNISDKDIAAHTTYGTKRKSAYEILEDSLNLRDSRVFDVIYEDGKEKRVLNIKETTLAAQKQQLIKDAFRDWIWKDPDRRQALVKQYNEEMNCLRPREYDGSHITFSGMNPAIELREHQKNAVAHVLYGGNTLLAHEVGAGKTFEMVASAMELKRLGLCSKSMVVVPNHLTDQWATEFLSLYPSANILVTTKKDFQPANRKKFCARIATGDYDAVIIGHSQFEKIPISFERQERLLREEIAEITSGITEMKSNNGDHFSVKQLEITKKKLEIRLEKMRADHKKDDVVTFEQLGVDRIFVDESDMFKNLFIYTKMRNVAGLSTSEAQKSMDMFLKCRYLDEITENRGVIFATGTPISNSMTEMFTIQRYLQYDRLQEMGMGHFDCWASRFGETTTALELAPEGTGYRARTRFAKFFNLPELMNMFKEVADIKTADQLNLPTPEVEYHNCVSKPTETQQEMVKLLSERASKVHGGSVDPSEDNMLKITSDGRKLGLDQRIISPLLPDEETTKVNQCVKNILQYWRDGEVDKLTQLVFCDISTPKGKTAGKSKLEVLSESADRPFTIYDDIRDKLIANGMPPEQIAFIHDADTEAKKHDLFGKVRNGQVRVLIGSTQKMGAGTNVQDRLIALHDLDCPWRPRDLIQRKGRIERQGNMNPKVHVCRYVTEGTFDAYLWQTIENKQKFISQIMTSKSPVRSCEDVDEAALSYAEIKALCAGDPRIKERMDLDVDVSKLKVMKAEHQSNQYRLEDNLVSYFPKTIEQFKGYIKGFEADKATLAKYPMPFEGFIGMEVRGDKLTDKENAGAALLDTLRDVKTKEPVLIGKYRGFDMYASYNAFEQEHELTLRGEMSHKTALGTDARGNITRIDNVLGNLDKRLEDARQYLDDLYKQRDAAQSEVGKPFPHEQELTEKVARLTELDTLLNLAGKGEISPDQIVAKSSRPSVLDKLKDAKEQSKAMSDKKIGKTTKREEVL